jgi:hypothetical protein
MAAAPPLPKSYEEAAQLHLEVEAELERVCASPHFRSSRRSCEFLRYVVRVALDGRPGSLKERSIGIDFFGRETSYDPSSDATVRVRANEVRKRLGSYYGSIPVVETFRITLPTGTYVPRFLPADAVPLAPSPPGPPGAQPLSLSPAPAAIVPLSSLVRMRPAFFALLLCALLLRHSLESRENYQRFWDRILAGRKVAFLSMPLEDRDRLASGLYPFVWIAGRFGVPTVLSSAPLTGATTDTFAKVRLASSPPANWQTDKRLRWLLDAGAGPTLTVRDQSGQTSASVAPHAALLTILPESPSILYVQSTDEDALRKLFEELTADERFPGSVVVPASGPMRLQILLTVDPMDHSTVQVWEPQP